MFIGLRKTWWRRNRPYSMQHGSHFIINIHSLYNRLIFFLNKYKGYAKAYSLYLRSRIHKRCYFGPFTGEFGHLLGHNLPFIAHLYSKGVKVEFCGLDIHKPFFVDESGNSNVYSYTEVRDFFNESAPNCNRAEEPDDVKAITSGFKSLAQKSTFPYWDNKDEQYYFYAFRWWVNFNRFNKVYDLSKVYRTKSENSAVIFPRKWNSNSPFEKQLENNGEQWNYFEIANTISPYFDKVYVIGHPVFSDINFNSFGNVEVHLTQNNNVILEKCSNSKLIITPHSGAVYLGEYTNCQVLIIYKGGRVIGEIEITNKFKRKLGNKYPFQYAYTLNEIQNFAKQYEAIRD